jgi:GTP-binding protein YchF
MSGRSTVFEALTRQGSDPSSRRDDRLAVVCVPDERLDRLSGIFVPRKAIYAQVEYLLPGQESQKKDPIPWTAVKECDALIQVVRNYDADRNPAADLRAIEQELMLSDLVQVEKRLERIELDHRRGKKMNPEEHQLLRDCRRLLESEVPLRRQPELADAKLLRGFAFLTAKPILVLFNNEENDQELPEMGGIIDKETCLVIRGKLEQELSRMNDEEAVDFLAEYGIGASAMDRVIRRSYEVMRLMSFFTVGRDEVRAWTIRAKTPAVEAAGVIHSDMQKGFIRAEVVSYDDLIAAGSMADARKHGTVRLESKTYQVEDGDIITFRFNV